MASPILSKRPGWDVFLLGLLVFASMQIIAFGETAVPHEMRIEDVARHPLLGQILSDTGESILSGPGPRPAGPLSLILQALTLGFLILYGLADLALRGRWQQRAKWIFLALILTTALYLPTAKFILLRDIRGPASYAHDGGVIQTESTIDYLLSGKNPYTEDYVETPMAEWGFSEYRTALYHYPYLPWTFVFSAPFYLMGQALGLYDQRIVYLFLLTVMLFVAPRLTDSPRRQLALVATLALNPIMALDIVFGQNDIFVLCWILFSLACWRQWWLQQQRLLPHHNDLNDSETNNSKNAGEGNQRWLFWSALLFGLACASKPTAWFFAPFYGLLLVWDRINLEGINLEGVAPEGTDPERNNQPQANIANRGWRIIFQQVPHIVKRAVPALAVFALLLLPYILWDPYALYDDVWRWSTGQGETGYQIWGWGASNFVIGLGLVQDRFDQWPFWMLELLIALPVFLWFIRRQVADNRLATACWHYGLGLLVFFYTSRFLNENYLGYIFAFLAIGILCEWGDEEGKGEER